MQIKGNKHIWWIGAAILSGGLCMVNACSNTSNEMEKGKQSAGNNIKEKRKKAIEQMNTCASRGRYTSCWIPWNSCKWYKEIVDAETEKWGKCMLDCADVKEKKVCNSAHLYHCSWDFGRCYKNGVLTKPKLGTRGHFSD